MAHKDPNSWRASANRVRDARHTKVDDTPKKVSAKKNTRRWCRGKAGVEHKPKCVDYRTTKNYRGGFGAGYAKGWKLLICTDCGKELDRYWPFGDEKKNPPAWVTEVSCG